MGNTYFEHNSLHKYTRVAGCQDGVEVMSMVDLVLVKKDCCTTCSILEKLEEGDETSQILLLYCVNLIRLVGT